MSVFRRDIFDKTTHEPAGGVFKNRFYFIFIYIFRPFPFDEAAATTVHHRVCGGYIFFLLSQINPAFL